MSVRPSPFLTAMSNYFNNHIEVFPNNMINTLTLGKKSIRPFRDHAAAQSFDYRPNF